MLESNFLTSLIDAGNDAFKNLYYASFTGGIFEDNEAFTIRLNGFDAPEDSHDSYPVTFMNAKIEYPTAKVNVVRHFTLVFRVDANYFIYKKLLEQKNKVFNLSKLITVTDLNAIKDSLFTTNIFINKSDGINQDGKSSFDQLFSFSNCWISSLSLSEYSSDNSTPVTVTAEVNFLEKTDSFEGNEE